MDLGLLSVVLLISCLVFSAFFSGLEMALTSLSAVRSKKLMDEKPIYAPALSLWLKKPNHVLVTILVGNNVVNTLAAATAALLAQSFFKSFAISIATFVMTLLILIFGEITPKTFARHNAEKIAPLGMMILLPIYALLWPATLVMNSLAAKIVKLIGGNSNTTPLTSEEDIAYLIRIGHEEGILTRNDGQMLQSVIEFRKTIAKEAMVPRTEICSFEVHTPYEEVVRRIIEEGHTRWPVYEGNIDNIIGIFHAKDLLSKLGHKPFSLRDLLHPAKFVPDMMKIGHLLREFQAGKMHLFVVVDEYGGTAGIISLEDVLEEIVGEIRDEYDDEEQERTVQQLDANNYLVNGKAKIFELGKVLDVTFPDSHAFDSLGGFLIDLYGRLPPVGAKISYHDCTFLIKSADEKKVSVVHVHQSRVRPKLHELANDSTIEERVAA